MRFARLLLPFVLGGCGGGVDSHEEAAEALIEVYDDLNAVLDDVTDEATAEAARPKLEAIAARMEEVYNASSKLPKPTREEASRTSSELVQALGRHAARFQDNWTRIARDPEAMKVVAGTMKDVASRMKSEE